MDDKYFQYPIDKKIIRYITRNKIYKMAVQNAFNHIIITDENGTIVYANSAVERITGYPVPEVIGKTPRLWGRQMNAPLYEKLWHTIKVEKKPFAGEFQNKRKNGTLYTAKAVISPILDDDDNLIGYIGTEEDITKEKEIDKMKSEFISITAHQLSTPLTCIQWAVELLEENPKSFSPEQIDFINQIKGNTQHLSHLVKDLLNVARVESGRLSITPVRTDPVKLVATVVNDMEHSHFDQKNQTVKVEISELPEMLIDPHLLRQVLMNLLSNASKYSPEKSVITVTGEKNNDEAVFKIIDQGSGIPEAEQKKIGTKFYRASNIQSVQKGNGLGLYFIYEIMNQTGCALHFASKENEGTTFSLHIPLTGMKSKVGEVGLS